MNRAVFLQKRAHRAGAQTCLARMLRHEGMRPWNPVLVCSEPGWLTTECERNGVAVLVQPFPSSRALTARLWGNAAFARRVTKRVAALPGTPVIVHANDHWEGLLGLAGARELRARTVMHLRSPGMREADYWKYRCGDYDSVVAVGDEIQARAKGWDAAKDIRLVHDGIEPSEFSPPKPKAAEFPRRVLVLGSPLDWKGWADLTEALFQLEQAGALPELQFDFTGAQPDPAQNDLKLGRLRRARCNFLGRVEMFRELVLGYDLVINPSRMETFGMAAVEVLAAGVPLLTTRVGILDQAQAQAELLVVPHQPAALATALKNLLQNWPAIEFGLARSQENLRAKFLVGHTVAKLTAEFARLAGSGERA
ncbi:MAG: group 1 glycosyl transferase [Limisphaerales bacterium]|nr:MAG: group 1 glycosyl transferase [Limisphaerales bacterium]KAG0507746.1 MAG: group 1 glycosyl transferase [Limisphaerales bacterium]TXT51089.1 MAG: group 1 glycosyl transferase [Limisphaerales bacterium]